MSKTRAEELLAELVGRDEPQAVEWLHRNAEAVRALAALDFFEGEVPALGAGSFRSMATGRDMLVQHWRAFQAARLAQQRWDALQKKSGAGG